jgi:hypothetical protein
MPPEPRSREQRTADALHRLETDVDVWVATAATDGTPYLVPLSFDWDGRSLVVATVRDSPTGRNLRETATARLALGTTRDVVMVEATAEPADLDTEQADAFARRTGFDPRELAGYAFTRLRPVRVQAWRESNELAGRVLMRDGEWVTTSAGSL